ncbi:hypothetical protein J6590_000129 [Homalodisca vitripennis]|nr:hypothetical protein J6590_000129 [Homalodisca vitripennis]
MWIPVLLVISNFLLLSNSESVCKQPNTGTVLFRNIDIHRRQCWSSEELALLYTRRAMMELVPRQIPHNIPLILEYMQICLTTLKETVTSKVVYDYMFAALADTFGGYLQTYGLPLLHEAYYEGYVSYDTAVGFHRLQDEFKGFLMTNGEGWTRPMEVRKHINRILPLKLPTTVSSKPCALLFSEATCLKSAADEQSDDTNQTNSLIPLPILDDSKQPNSIAIPFKNRALFNLKNRNSYDILIKYYIEASRCITNFHKTGTEQAEFDHVFSDWLKTKVGPHLKDEAWYVGFSNVLRIEETIHQRGGMVAEGSAREREEESLFSELESEAQLTQAAYIAIAIILIVSLLVICFLYWAFIKHCFMCCGKLDVESANNSGDPSETSSLLSGTEDSSNGPSTKGRARRKGCKHFKNKSDSTNPDSQSIKSVTDESRVALSFGLGKGFPPRCRKHRH